MYGTSYTLVYFINSNYAFEANLNLVKARSLYGRVA